MQHGGGPENNLMASAATEITSQWLHGLRLVDEAMQEDLPEERRKEWQQLGPVMMGSFQIASEMIQKVTFSDQASLDRVCSSGLVLPLRFLLPFGDVAATWQLKCTLQAARLLFGPQEKQAQDSAVAVAPTCSVTKAAPLVPFLAPSHDVRLTILQTAAAIFIGKD